ncbi:vWA domain-containing protein [Tropicibacter sp. S64]|uniref:vWA domain-containing protein n=1 Tax=Tropicibacter sp. S64 TaxID=3415122 RepID=UPI003C7AD9C2
MPLRSFKFTASCLALSLVLAACSEAPVEPVVMMEPVADAASESVPSSLGGTGVRAGVVTAGDIDDTRNLASFLRYQKKAARETRLPTVNATPLAFQVVDAAGKPAPGVAYTLRRPGGAEPVVSGYTGVDGYVTVFGARQNRMELRLFSKGEEVARDTVSAGKARQTVQVPVSSTWQPEFLDLVFVFDTTGSMGDELKWLTTEFRSIVSAAKQAAPGVNMRFGLIAYRDQGDEYVTRDFGFTKSAGTMQGWLSGLNADGGGDYPEASDRALAAAAQLDWRRGKGERIVFHVADAPAHDDRAKAYLNAAEHLAGKGVQIFGLGASGTGTEAEFLMRQAALVSEGRYLFLTDDSGVGLSHEEPTISCYRVTALKDLLVRVLRSELSGLRQEASKGAVIRSVGNYRAGVCAE